MIPLKDIRRYPFKNILNQTIVILLRSMKNGSVSWAVACALSYFYMVSAWGGYVYIINLIPLHVLGNALH